MPEYSQIQTYMKCNEKKFSLILSTFFELLKEVGFDGEYISSNFHGLTWEVEDNGFVYCGSNTSAKSVENYGALLKVRPMVMGWTSEAIPSLNESWLEISLLFETEEIIEDHFTFKIKNDIKKALLNYMMLMSHFFSDSGVYLTDEVTDGKPQEAIWGDGNDFWYFDLAIIPFFLEEYYKETPRKFCRQIINGKLCYANGQTWGEMV